MPSLNLSPDYISRLVFKVRGVQTREGLTDPDPGSNPSDDKSIDVLQDDPGDLSRGEIVQELRGLDEQERQELVALLWLGRGDFEAEEWNQALLRASERKETPAEHYLLTDPLVADYWAEGLSRLGYPITIPEEERPT